ncbi:MAG TPA: hypothetical protein VIU62_01805 [Chloroflexota bacterium]
MARFGLFIVCRQRQELLQPTILRFKVAGTLLPHRRSLFGGTGTFSLFVELRLPGRGRGDYGVPYHVASAMR